MALMLKYGFEAYQYAVNDMADPRTQDWFLVKSPITIAFLLITYLIMVYEILPKFMENRKPYNLRSVLLVYNLLQICLSGYLVIRCFSSVLKLDVRCSPVDYSNDPEALKLAHLTWCYFMIKIIDLFDTFFFILRKKFNQASFLHVYHHFGVLFVGWMGTKYIAGGESIFLGFINSFVHIFMYAYYFYCAWKPENRDRVLKWKKHLTQLQIVQFFTLLCIYAPKIFTDCNFPKMLHILVVPQDLFMIIMFGEFYYKTYIKRNADKTKHAKQP